MEGYNEEREVGSEEGRLWLPFHVLVEAMSNNKKENVKHQQGHNYQRNNHLNKKRPAYQDQAWGTKSSPRPNTRTRCTTNKAPGGPGMQAVFLESGQKPSGTGVFLPPGLNFRSNKKSDHPACSPVFLPARVVQALNLDVKAIGLQVSCRQVLNVDTKNSSRLADNDTTIQNKTRKDVAVEHRFVAWQYENAPELNLPKEWTY